VRWKISWNHNSVQRFFPLQFLPGDSIVTSIGEEAQHFTRFFPLPRQFIVFHFNCIPPKSAGWATGSRPLLSFYSTPPLFVDTRPFFPISQRTWRFAFFAHCLMRFWVCARANAARRRALFYLMHLRTESAEKVSQLQVRYIYSLAKKWSVRANSMTQIASHSLYLDRHSHQFATLLPLLVSS
jgi:hypothetical protein